MNKETFEIKYYESLKIRKRGNYYFAYARYTEQGGQKERYLGRCNKDGTPYIHKCPWARYRGYEV